MRHLDEFCWATEPLNIASYRLATGDKITVTVHGQKDISGEYTIDGVGNILLPIVGPIVVGNLTTSECERRIVQKLADGVLKRPSVFVGSRTVPPDPGSRSGPEARRVRFPAWYNCQRCRCFGRRLWQGEDEQRIDNC